MPMMLVCNCGHSTLLPDQSGSYKCSQCGAHRTDLLPRP
jgi:hypothetical protein